MRISPATILLIIGIVVSVQANAQITYSSPMPNSEYNSPESNIIFKFNQQIINTDNFNTLFIINGTKSGRHTYNFKISEKKTLLLYPKLKFEIGERITVRLTDTINLAYKKVVPLQYSFTISTRAVRQASSDLNFIELTKPANTESSDNFPSVTIPINDNPAPGKIFFYNLSDMASNNDRFLAIIDNTGNPEYKRQENEIGLGFTLQPSGYMSLWNNQDFVLMDSSYNIIDTVGCGNGYSADFHEFIHLPNGHSFLLAWDVQQIDMSKIVENGDINADVQGLIIQELDIDKNVVFQWRSWDHFNITDAIDIDFTTPYVSYVHGNALAISADGNLLLSSRVMNEITKINLTTGEIIWRLGGKNNQFNFINDPDKFCRQHHIQEIKNGNITLYDNGTCHNPQISKAKEYKLDEVNKTAELVWEYQHPKNIYCSTMGSVQRLENGNTFIAWGMVDNEDFPDITEVRPDKTIAFELYFDTFFHLLYRSFRFVWDNDVVSTNFIKTHESDNTVTLSPNPANRQIQIQFRNSINSLIKIYDISGNLVLSTSSKKQFIESNKISIDVGSLANGIYFLHMENKGLSIVKKFIISK